MGKSNILTGNLWKAMFSFAIPLIIMNLLQASDENRRRAARGVFRGKKGARA